MNKIFNTEGYCDPKLHYMVDLSGRLKEITAMVDAGKYFTINRGRQYGKTTILTALAVELKKRYVVVSLDFQQLGAASFESESTFSQAFARIFLRTLRRNKELCSESFQHMLKALETDMSVKKDAFVLLDLFDNLCDICGSSEKPVVLMIDEVDSASNNQVFIDFLAQLRFYYLKRMTIPTFQSVILAGVHDVRNIKRKIRPDEDHKVNSPWNIAAEFLVDMSFSVQDIAGMLGEYEKDYHTGMNVQKMANLLYDYTSGYPFLVSRLCKLMDEQIAGSECFPDKCSAWTPDGFQAALKIVLNESNPLYQSMKGKLESYPELRNVLYDLLFTGKPVPYMAMNDSIEVATMFGFIKSMNGTAVISNRIFETVLYNWFMSEEYANSKMYEAGLQDKNQFVVGGHLNVRRILEKFVESFDYLYGDQNEEFLEDAGRRYFMLFLKPIINGTGNSYVEAETRNRERMDLVIDYHGEQFIIEMKVWRGNAYNERGEEQLSGYLDYFHLKKGYMLSFNFNKKKEIGLRDIVLGDRLLVEAVV